MAEVPQWMPREQWDALVRGEGCPLCAELIADEEDNAYGYTIEDLSIGRLRLARNQSVPGYCLLICKTHVREPYELSREDRIAFFEDLMRAGLALEQVFGEETVYLTPAEYEECVVRIRLAL